MEIGTLANTDFFNFSCRPAGPQKSQRIHALLPRLLGYLLTLVILSWSVFANAGTLTFNPPGPVLATAIVGTPFNLQLNVTGGTAPYIFKINAGSLPRGITFNVTGKFTGIPTRTGKYHFSVTANDSSSPAPATGSIDYDLYIQSAPVPPIASDVTAAVAFDSRSNAIRLNLGGGAATSVAITSAAKHGTATATGTAVSYTPNPGYAGADSFNYTATNLDGTSAPATVRLTIAAEVRQDMSRDAEVLGVLSAQAASAQRFASGQLGNFTRRLESLHGEGWGRSEFGIRMTRPTVRHGDAGDLSNTSNTQGQLQATGANTPADNADLQALSNFPRYRDNGKQTLAFWSGGTVDFGQNNADHRQPGSKFTTSGISIGGDYRINDLATLGLGAGYSKDSSDVGNNGSSSSAQSTSVAIYGSLRPATGMFIDGVLGYGTLDFDSTRYITDGGGFATGTRGGRQVFGALVSGVEFRRDRWLLSPYGRLEMSAAKLDAYSEKAAGSTALTYYQQRLRNTSGTLGLRAETELITAIGTWSRHARIEYSRQFSGTGQAQLAFADRSAAGPAYSIDSATRKTGRWSAGIGGKLTLRNSVTLMLDYSTNMDVGNGSSQGLLFSVALPFS